MLRYRDMLPVRSRSLTPYHHPSRPVGAWGAGPGSPFDWMRQIQNEMDRMFAGLFAAPAPTAGPAQAAAGAAAVRVEENADEYVLQMEVPGVAPEEIEVTTTGDLLTVRGQGRTEGEDRHDGYTRSTRSYRSFQRTFPLPATVQTDAVTAEYQNGLLQIHLPKSEEAKRRVRRIPIVAGDAAQPAIEGEKAAEAPPVAGAKGAEASSPEVEKETRRRSGKAEA